MKRPCGKCGAEEYNQSKWRNGEIFACNNCSDMSLRTTQDPTSVKTLNLLKEWYDYWKNAEDMPTKMPNALHLRTALILSEHDIL